MTLVRRLYLQFRHLIDEGAKFLVVGGIGLIITNGVYSLMRHYDAGPVTSTTVATIVATVFTYVGNRYWSFRHRERTGVAREGGMFLVLNGVGLLIQDAVVGFGAYVLGFQHGHRIEQLITLNVGIAIATVFRFWSYRRWVWAAPAEPAGPAAESAVMPVPPPPPAGQFINGLEGSGLVDGSGYVPEGNGRSSHVNGHDRSSHASGRDRSSHVSGQDSPAARRR